MQTTIIWTSAANTYSYITRELPKKIQKSQLNTMFTSLHDHFCVESKLQHVFVHHPGFMRYIKSLYYIPYIKFVYGVATISRLLKITGLFCKKAL